jgi:putative ABC transport system ATP-binding protein
MEILGLKDAKSRAANLLESVELTARGHHYPTELSGGEQQRIAIARAFANRPKILLADEPTGNLDSRNGAHIFDLMTELHRQNNVSLILVTHDQNLADKAQRQIILKDGRVLSDNINQRSD